MNDSPRGPLLLVDTDLGYDDVMAIAMLLAAEAPIAGLTIVHGLAHVGEAAENLLELLERVGLSNIPVAVGAPAPLAGGYAFPDPWRDDADALVGIGRPPTDRQPLPVAAAEFLVTQADQNPGRITLLCLGPLTNVALALQQAGERFVKNVERIVVMGGAVRVPGNGTPNAVSEWNFYVDARAASLTIRSGIPVVMIGLDVTNQAPCTAPLVEALCAPAAGGEAGRIMQEAMRRMYTHLYDPVATAYLLDPSIVQTTRLPIRVVTEGPNVGQTVEDPEGDPVDVALTLDYPRFRRLLQQLIVG